MTYSISIAGLAYELFGDDPEGIVSGLLYQEGRAWHHSRKLLSHNFNLADLDSYIDTMDSSALEFVRILGDQKSEFVENKVLKELSSQLSFELIAKNILGKHIISKS